MSDEQLQRARLNGICCAADGEVRPFSSDLPTILRAIEAAALVGLRIKMDPDQVKILQGYLGGARNGEGSLKTGTNWAIENAS